MTTTERLQAILHHRHPDRLPLVEWAGWWDATIRRWHQEGLPPSCTDRYDICRHFTLDVWKQTWISVRGPGLPSPPRHGGGIIATMDDYLALRPKLLPGLGDCAYLSGWNQERALGDIGTWFTCEGFFWFARSLLGVEEHLLAFYDQPELLHRINQDLADWMIAIIPQLASHCRFDFMTFAEDLSYNHGPMISPTQFHEFLTPYYQQVIPILHEHGIVPLVDSDGDVAAIIPDFITAGLAGLLPLERQAGVDVVALRHHHPDVVFIGGFDKMTMSHGETAMRKEFERLLPAAQAGRFAIACDHQTPPEVSYQNYRCYRRLFEEYATQL